jgi:hypothetical protein
MDLKVAQTIASAAHDLGLGMTVRESYSGRGMYGKTTAALEYDRESDLIQAACYAMEQVVRAELGDGPVSGAAGEEEPDLDGETFMAGLPRSRDNMGMGYVAY